MRDGSKKAVVTAIVGNSIVTILKFFGFGMSGSSSLLAEAVHSVADTVNQCLLYLGLRRSERNADNNHHFGYGQERYFWNLVSAVTIFFVGCVYTIVHATEDILSNHIAETSVIAFITIGAAFLLEGYSMMVALSEFNSQRKKLGYTFIEYFNESRDPTTIAVLAEDSAALLGLTFALIGMSLTSLTGIGVWDGIAAILIGVLMGALAYFLSHVNKKYLINASDHIIDDESSKIWDDDEYVQNVQRINSIVIDPNNSILMAEIELREESMFKDMSSDEIKMAIKFMKRLNSIRYSLESEVRKKAPQAKHIFLEFVGVADDVKKSNKEPYLIEEEHKK